MVIFEYWWPTIKGQGGIIMTARSMKTQVLEIISKNLSLKKEIREKLGGYPICWKVEEKDDIGYVVELLAILNGERG